MSHQTITEFDIVFALHTGVTIMMPKQSAFDKNDEAELLFRLSEPADGMITLHHFVLSIAQQSALAETANSFSLALAILRVW